ncbi:MAG: hypothetical protein Q4A84_03670 [Neisseria sp.]|uniref:hypothetical protein n=1 Tax=Neisseria sp. TaxID=192066 RepID=UPI0026DCEF33|nr:hypothetical protein [Neisseria sp.]MDO4640788.1 hypothetical protein [Neisseria sp.]
MGFIADTLKAEHDKYILLNDIVLFVQSLDTETPSLADTAKYLLRKYEEHRLDIPFEYVDENPFEKDMTERFVPTKTKDGKPFFHFLRFVATYDCFDYGCSDDNPNWTEYNDYQNIYLGKEAVNAFLKESGLPELNQPTPIQSKPDTAAARAKIDELKAEIERLKDKNQQLEAENQNLTGIKKQIDDRTALLNIVYALKVTLTDKGTFNNQAAVIDYLSNEFSSYGLSESNLRAKFAEANQTKKSN